MTNVLISAAGLCGATIIGAILGFFVKELPHKWNDAVLGYCAGIMLAASTLGLIVPAFEQTGLWWLVVIGVMAGALFLNVLDLVTPHLHHIYHGTRSRGASQQCQAQSCDAFRDGNRPAQIARGHGSRSERLLSRRCNGVGRFLRHRPAEHPRGNGDYRSFDDGWCFCSPYLLHFHLHRPARSGRHSVGFRFGFSLYYLPPRDAGFCRWCHALCNERRDDSRNPCPWLSEASHLRPSPWIHHFCVDGEMCIIKF